jgi:lipopolysaccharide transport system permease protein
MSEIVKHQPSTIYIKPTKGLAALNLRDLWIYRELVFFMVWRDVKVKYKQTLLGMAWAVIQPVMTMLVFTFVFGSVAKVATDGIPYPVFSFAALLPWGLFEVALNQGSRSLVAHNNMVTKIYFPRLILPMSSVFAGLVDFVIAFVILIGLMFYYRISPAYNLLWTLPLFILLAIVTALGVALWLSAINVRYRDVNQALPFLTRFWLFVTPIAYSSEIITGKWQYLYYLNPMAGVVDGFRWALLGTGTGPGITLWVSTGISILILITGLFYFRSMEKTFADTI